MFETPTPSGAPMATWHRLGLRDELLARVPFSIKLERHQIAVFVHEGRFTAMDGGNPRFSTSDALLEHAMEMARELKTDTQLIKLRNLKFQHCEGNYSKASHACTWPCAITERDPEDQLSAVYEGLVHWADVVIISTPIRWGNASALYYKLAERPNCVQNQITIHDK